MIIVNPDGTLHRHQKIGDALVELEPLHNPDFAAPVDPLETVAHSIAYWIQSLLEIGNPAEMVMQQGKSIADIEVSGSFRAYGNQWYIVSFNLGDKTTKNERVYYELKIDVWDGGE